MILLGALSVVFSPAALHGQDPFTCEDLEPGPGDRDRLSQAYVMGLVDGYRRAAAFAGSLGAAVDSVVAPSAGDSASTSDGAEAIVDGLRRSIPEAGTIRYRDVIERVRTLCQRRRDGDTELSALLVIVFDGLRR